MQNVNGYKVRIGDTMLFDATEDIRFIMSDQRRRASGEEG